VRGPRRRPRSATARLRCGVTLLALGVLLPLAARAADAGDPCAGFTWDVRHERALFGGTPQSLAAGTTTANAPALSPDKLYELQLSALSLVTLAVPAGRHASSPGAGAGLATLTLAQAGLYRISLDVPIWVDVIAGSNALRSQDFQGRPGCNAPHKIVEFVLPAATRLTLQLSGDSAKAVKVAVSRSPQPPQ